MFDCITKRYMSPMVYAIISIKCLQNGHHSAILTFEKKIIMDYKKNQFMILKSFLVTCGNIKWEGQTDGVQCYSPSTGAIGD